MPNIEKEKQIASAQYWVEIISRSRPQLKGQKVVDVEATDHPFECIVRFNDWKAIQVVGLDAKMILAGKLPVEK